MIEKVKLGDCVEFQRGYDLTHTNMSDGPYPVVGSTSIIGHHRDYKAEDGITLGRSGTVGIPQLIRGKYWPHNTTLFTTDLKGNDLEYLFYLLRNLHIDKLKTGSNIPTLNRNDIYPIVVPFEKDVSEQKKIAYLLSLIDAKIANNTAVCSDLEAMATLLYDYWFVQFDFPDENGKPYKSSGGKMVWNEELKREIPEGWNTGSLYDIADFVNGLACQKFRPFDNEHRLPVIKIGEMHNGFGADVEWARDDVPDKHIICDGDILFSWSASLEVMLWNKGKGVLNQHIFNVIPKKDRHYVLQQLSAYVVNFVRMAEARKTTMGHITTDHLKQSRIVLPPRRITDMYGKTVSDMYSKSLASANENQQLTSLRDFLLPMLMNGQVKVGKAGA